VQDEDCFLKPDGVHGAIRSVRIVFDHLQHRSVSKAFQRLGCFVPLAVRTRTGNAIKSFLLLPIQINGVSTSRAV
jgi:hypothetical protein